MSRWLTGRLVALELKLCVVSEGLAAGRWAGEGGMDERLVGGMDGWRSVRRLARLRLNHWLAVWLARWLVGEVASGRFID